MADKDLDLSFQPQFLALEKDFQVGGGRLTGKKQLDEGNEIEAYADLTLPPFLNWRLYVTPACHGSPIFLSLFSP